METERRYILAKSSRTKGDLRSDVLFFGDDRETTGWTIWEGSVKFARILSQKELESIQLTDPLGREEVISFIIGVPSCARLELSNIFGAISRNVEIITRNCGLINAIDIHANAVSVYYLDTTGKTFVVEDMIDGLFSVEQTTPEMPHDTSFRFLDLG
jgi:hypothetical protein